jgi:hypothetical protein
MLNSDLSASMLGRVRKLLAKAAAEGVTGPEAEALTAKAAELMARYGIDRARLAAVRPDTDRPANRTITIGPPFAQVSAHLLAGLAGAMRCQCVLLATDKEASAKIHVFGYASDIERADILYTSLMLQMARGLMRLETPPGTRSVRAFRRSWLLGFCTAVITRVQAAEDRAVTADDAGNQPEGRRSTALVLADRSVVIRQQLDAKYPTLQTTRITYSGRGYGAGYAEGQRADIGSSRLNAARALTQ